MFAPPLYSIFIAFSGRAFGQGQLLVVVKILFKILTVGEVVKKGKGILFGSSLACPVAVFEGEEPGGGHDL